MRVIREPITPYEPEIPKRQFKGVWIPAEIWLHPTLSVYEKLLWGQIDTFCTSEKACFASNAYLSEFLGVVEGSLKNMLTNLRKLGLIETTGFDGRRRHLKTKLVGVIAELPEGSSQNYPYGHARMTSEPSNNFHKSLKNSNVIEDQIAPITKDITKIISLKKKNRKKESLDDPFFESMISDDFKRHADYPKFLSDWKDFIAHRSEIKKPLSALSAKRALNALQAFGIEGARSSIDKAIQSRWTGIWAPKNGIPENGQITKTSGFSEPDYTSEDV